MDRSSVNTLAKELFQKSYIFAKETYKKGQDFSNHQIYSMGELLIKKFPFLGNLSNGWLTLGPLFWIYVRYENTTFNSRAQRREGFLRFMHSRYGQYLQHDSDASRLESFVNTQKLLGVDLEEGFQQAKAHRLKCKTEKQAQLEVFKDLSRDPMSVVGR